MTHAEAIRRGMSHLEPSSCGGELIVYMKQVEGVFDNKTRKMVLLTIWLYRCTEPGCPYMVVMNGEAGAEGTTINAYPVIKARDLIRSLASSFDPKLPRVDPDA